MLRQKAEKLKIKKVAEDKLMQRAVTCQKITTDDDNDNINNSTHLRLQVYTYKWAIGVAEKVLKVRGQRSNYQFTYIREGTCVDIITPT